MSAGLLRGTERFFAYARERHSITLRRAAGEPRPWTKDEILNTYRFTCVFRELDKTTVWFREHVRDRLRGKPEVLLATVVFRMLNRIEVGEAVFCQTDLISKNHTAFEAYLDDGNVRHLRRAIRQYCPRGPYVTGAYIISSPPGMTKLDGVLWVIDNFAKTKCETPWCGKTNWRCAAEWLLKHHGNSSLEKMHDWLSEMPYLGNFHSYEITTDLRHTALLDEAPDVMSWCSIGPGARRGINRVMGRDKRDHSVSVPAMLGEMRALLDLAKTAYWPKKWPCWEMRDVEHTLCEFDKYERVRLGEGTPRGVYR